MKQFLVKYRSIRDDLSREVTVEAISEVTAGETARAVRDDIHYVVSVTAL